MGPLARSANTVGDLLMFDGAVYNDPPISWADPMALTSVDFVTSPVLGCNGVHDLLVGSYKCRTLFRMPLDSTREQPVLSAPELADGVADNGTDTCAAEQSSILLASGLNRITDTEIAPDGTLYVMDAGRRSLPHPSETRSASATQTATWWTTRAIAIRKTRRRSPFRPRFRESGSRARTRSWAGTAQGARAGNGHGPIASSRGRSRSFTWTADSRPPARSRRD